MVTYVPNKQRKVTIIVDIGVLAFNAHCLCLMQSAVDLPFALETCCAFATSLLRLSQTGLNLLFFFFFMRGLCAVYL